ncbi:MAG: ABC transporter ATP-binding protein [Clostridiales bacterium]|nr:ABC transporter ATP-binding protein [Clostridiales bacterium]
MLKNILECAKEFKKQSILAASFVGMEVVIGVLTPIIMAKLIDKGITLGNINVVIKLGVLLVVISFASLMFGVLCGIYTAIASNGFARNLRRKIYYKIQDFSFFNIDKFKASSLLTRLTTDINNVRQAFQMSIRVAVGAPMMLLFSLFMAFSINKKMSIIFAFAIVFLGTGLYFIISRVHVHFKKTFETYDMLNNVVQENLRNIKTVKSYVREDFENNKFQKISKELYKNFINAEKIISFNSPLMQFSIYTSIILIAWFGSKLITVNGMTRGELISFIAYTGQILISLMMISGVLVMLLISRNSLERIYEILREEIDLKEKKNSVGIMESGDIIFKNVNFGYLKSETLCLKDINISIESGESIGIVGETGSSKSTLVQLIPRLYDVSDGEILINGVNVKDYSIDVLRDNIAVVFQKNILFSGTIRENLCMGNNSLSDEEIMNACDIACATEFIEKLENKLDSEVKQEGSNFSGGQKQRLCIARALLKKPKILILDDSTSAVDTKTDTMIRQGLKKNLPSTTKIIISQRILSVLNLDRILVMNNGCVNAIGTHDELMKTNKLYQEIYRSQVREEYESEKETTI